LSGIATPYTRQVLHFAFEAARFSLSYLTKILLVDKSVGTLGITIAAGVAIVTIVSDSARPFPSAEYFDA
jgi:hypothetical protein